MVLGPIRRVRAVHARVREGFVEFLGLEVSGSIVLLVATVAALALANSPLQGAFETLWRTELGVELGDLRFSESLRRWIDDGLMALFFFVVGLEIKREVVVGELSSFKKAALPMVAALGGMIGPALLFLAVNRGGEGARGWGIPMATDIAFSLGVLAALGSRVPANLKVFLAALAIVDDIGAVIVIAAFYTSEIAWSWLLLAAVFWLAVVALNVLGAESPLPYALAGTAVWFCVLHSGVHATMAGVLVAFAIPTRARMEPLEFVSWARAKLGEIEAIDVPGEHVLKSDAQQEIAQRIQAEARWIQAPLQRMEHSILPVTTYIVLPLFGLANAGVRIVGQDPVRLMSEPVALGIVVGLVVGKQAGIFGMAMLAVRLGLADLPSGVTWRHLYGAALLGGIGFTMSLFINGLAFESGPLHDVSKVAIIAASLVAGTAGYLVLRGARSRAPAVAVDG